MRCVEFAIKEGLVFCTMPRGNRKKCYPGRYGESAAAAAVAAPRIPRRICLLAERTYLKSSKTAHALARSLSSLRKENGPVGGRRN